MSWRGENTNTSGNWKSKDVWGIVWESLLDNTGNKILDNNGDTFVIQRHWGESDSNWTGITN